MNGISGAMLDMVQGSSPRVQDSTQSTDTYRDMMKKMMKSEQKKELSQDSSPADKTPQDNEEDEMSSISQERPNGDPLAALLFMMAGNVWQNTQQPLQPAPGSHVVQPDQEITLQPAAQTEVFAEPQNTGPVLPTVVEAEPPVVNEDAAMIPIAGNQPESQVPVDNPTGLGQETAPESILKDTPHAIQNQAATAAADTVNALQKPKKSRDAEPLSVEENVQADLPSMLKVPTESHQMTPNVPVKEMAGKQGGETLEKALQTLPSDIADKLAAGKREFTVQLEPESLGKLMIKASYEDGKATISIICTNEKTLNVLSAHARDLGAILENSTGSPTDVYLNQKEQNYLEQEQNGQNGQQGQTDTQEEEKKKHNKKPESMDFLDQFRLGLI